jgi:RimJ/RimL family protein N-acetyltransferase
VSGHRDESDGVRLRPVEASDLDVLYEHRTDPEAAAMAAFPARGRDQFDAQWAKILLDDTAVALTILADGVVAGVLNSWPDEGRRLIGYWIGREYWGRGVATRALDQFVNEMPDRPLYARVAAHNAASIRVLQKCGFQRDHAQEALAPKPDDDIEAFIFVLAE